MKNNLSVFGSPMTLLQSKDDLIANLPNKVLFEVPSVRKYSGSREFITGCLKSHIQYLYGLCFFKRITRGMQELHYKAANNNTTIAIKANEPFSFHLCY